MIKAAIIGGSGYTGYELLRLLSSHPSVTVEAVTSRTVCGKAVSHVFPSLAGCYDDLLFTGPEDYGGNGGDYGRISADIFFTALPHAASMEVVAPLVEAGKKVIDLSADFRLKDAAVYERWYGPHSAPKLLDEAVYGLPELNRSEIKGARLVANPGCYPTGAALALAPALGGGLVKGEGIIIDSKSGVSGAGRSALLSTSFVEVASGFKAYKVGSHRHTPEIDQVLGDVIGKVGGKVVSGGISVTFTPHLLPVARGILTTAYATLADGATVAGVRAAYEDAYGAEPFVRLKEAGEFPDIIDVRGSNYCDVALYVDEEGGRLIVVSAIDNLVKGASGQAVQNMNLVCGFEETAGLTAPPLGF